MKAKIKKEPIRKVRNILKSKLNEGNINAIVINRARIVSCTKMELEDGTWRWNLKMELEELDRETRKIMTDNVCDTAP